MNYLKITPSDNVAVALVALKKGEEALGVTLTEDIPYGHKFALQDIAEGEKIIKYGYPIGYAKAPIKAGEHVHTHNLHSGLGGILTYAYNPVKIEPKPGRTQTFQGFLRKNGKAGVRNEIWIIPTVGCVNSVAQAIAAQAQPFIAGQISGIYAFTHPYGCSQLADDHLNTQKALAGLVHHPNAGGVLVLGLGCENNNIEAFKKVLGDYDPERVKFINSQDETDEIAAGVEAVKELCEAAKNDVREPLPSSMLTIGLKCGGSDGLSGITANPTVGAFSDLLCYGGGSTILTEVPEMFGAETILMDRCESREVFDKTVDMINSFKEYYMAANLPIYENPSPGNKAGGISTLEDKALGCTQKCGTSAVRDVLAYGEPVQKKGLSLLYAPGNDLVASTALAVSGAQIVLFTTGRGTPFGCPVPTVKISSNTPLYEKKSDWIDFNAGIVTETGDVSAAGEKLFDFVMKVASGEVLTLAEKHGMRGIAIFKTGVTL